MRQITVRLNHGELLKEGIEAAVKANGVTAGVVLAAVGGVGHAVVRLAGSTPTQPLLKEGDGPYEIVSLGGTLSPDGSHLHVAVADGQGAVLGGHLMPGCTVNVTCEVVLLAFDDVAYGRAVEGTSGFPLLQVTTKP